MATNSLGAIGFQAAEAANGFLERAVDSETPKAAADWSLAAKNAIAVALTCEQAKKTRNTR